MMLKVFAIYDSKAEAFFPPFTMKSKGEALRAIQGLINDPEHNFAKYSEDFTIFELGSWDDASARYDLHPTPVSMGLFVEFKRIVPLPDKG